MEALRTLDTCHVFDPHTFRFRFRLAFATANGLSGKDVLVSGHSLGGLAVNSMADLSNHTWAGFYQHANYVAYASPTQIGKLEPDEATGFKVLAEAVQPIFTPAIKAPLGEHDENVDFATIVRLHGEALATQLRDLTLAIYARAERIAAERGIILADTKFEFGHRADGTLVLADEVLTPDSSRFWDAALWQPGESLPSFDKQYVRDWLTKESGWDKASDTPPPPLPDDVVAATHARYAEALKRLAG